MKIFSELKPSNRKNKKYVMIFTTEDGTVLKKVHFGAKNMSDFTEHKDLDRKERFLKRFNKLIEKYKYNSLSPMTLSHLILWNKPTLKASYIDYKKRFNFF